jgi:hypothetical protein
MAKPSGHDVDVYGGLKPSAWFPEPYAVAFFRLCGSFATNYGRPYGCIITPCRIASAFSEWLVNTL